MAEIHRKRNGRHLQELLVPSCSLREGRAVLFRNSIVLRASNPQNKTERGTHRPPFWRKPPKADHNTPVDSPWNAAGNAERYSTGPGPTVSNRSAGWAGLLPRQRNCFVFPRSGGSWSSLLPFPSSVGLPQTSERSNIGNPQHYQYTNDFGEVALARLIAAGRCSFPVLAQATKSTEPLNLSTPWNGYAPLKARIPRGEPCEMREAQRLALFHRVNLSSPPLLHYPPKQPG